MQERNHPVEPLERSELRRLRALTRKSMRERRGGFLLEGFRAVESALEGPGRADLLVLTSRAREHDRAPALLAAARELGIPVREARVEDLASLADTSTPPGIVARVRWDPPRDPAGQAAMEELARLGIRRLLCLDGVSDPGNAGTLLRTADALGITGALLGRGTVEAGNPKTARAAAGSLLRFDYLAEDVDLPGVLQTLQHGGWMVWRAESSGGELPAGPAHQAWALVLGSEGHGVSPELDGLGRGIHIPQRAGAESLNVAVAGGILMYLLTRSTG